MPADETLNAAVDRELPSQLPVGRGTSVLLQGSCSHPHRKVRDVRLLVDGEEQSTLAHSMPRPGSLSSGDWWWGIVDFGRIVRPRTATIELEARLGLRRWARADLGQIPLVPGRGGASFDFKAAADRSDGAITGALTLEPTVAICTSAAQLTNRGGHRPPIELMSEQTYENWICVIDSDPRSTEADALRELIGDDRRFLLNDQGGRSGPGGVEGTLMHAPTEAPYLAVIENWEHWEPQTLQLMLDALEPEMCMVRAPGPDPRHRAGAAARRGGHQDLIGLALGDAAVEGCLLLRRELLNTALPFPGGLGKNGQMRWLALVGTLVAELGAAETARVLPTGAEGASPSPSSPDDEPVADGPTAPRDDPGGLAPRRSRPNWRADYFDRIIPALLAARVIQTRCGGFLSRGEKRELSRLSAQERSALRAGARIAVGRFTQRANRGYYRLLIRALAWRHLAPIRSRLIGLTSRDRAP